MTKFTSNNLMGDENFIYSTKLHWSVYLRALPFFLIGIFLLLLGPILKESAVIKHMILPFILFFVGGILDLLYYNILIKTSEFIITNKRIIMKKGIISTKTLELLHSKIESISISQGIGGKIFGYGDFAVVGSGGTINYFKTIEKPFNFRKAAQEEIKKAQKTA